MGTWIVTVACVLGLGAAAFVAVRSGGLPVVWSKRAEDETAGGWHGARRVFRGLAVGMTSGAFTGVLVAGLGGRLFMRVAAATSPDSAQGAITDAEEVVGEVTAVGTIGLVLFVGLFGGAVLGLAYRLLRPFLPGPAWFAGLVPTVIALGLLGRASGMTDPDNRDFAILEPTWLIALMIVGLVVLFGATLGATHEWLDARVPPLGRDARSIAWHLPVLPLVIVPTFAMVTLPALAVGAIASEPLRDLVRSQRVRRVMSTVLAALAAFAALRVGSDLVTIA